MSDKYAVLATYVDFKTVKTRNCVQLIFEVPFEGDAADKALVALGGVPRPSDPPWCGIVRVNVKPPPEPSVALLDGGKLLPSRKWETLAPAQQAGIRCAEKMFQTYLGSEEMKILPHESTADFVRRYCGVESRADIRPGSKAEQRWNLLESAYQAWLTEAQYGGSVR